MRIRITTRIIIRMMIRVADPMMIRMMSGMKNDDSAIPAVL